MSADEIGIARPYLSTRLLGAKSFRDGRHDAAILAKVAELKKLESGEN